MKVKCLSNSGADLPMTCRDPQSGFNEDTKFPLKLNKEYQVYGFTLFLGHVWYYLCDEHFTYYPRWNPSPLFEVTDGRMSKYWVFGYDRGGSKHRMIVAFPEWANDPYYYDKLSDGEKSAVEIFRHYKRLMDLEFIEA
jgi:hypothetical protein